MSVSTNGNGSGEEVGIPVETELDDEMLAQLDALLGEPVVSMTLWTEPLLATVVEELPEEERTPEDMDALESVVDVDFYFENHKLLELYSAMVYRSEDEPYVEGLQQITSLLTQRVEKGISLVEIAEEAESGAPIFIFEDVEGEGSLLVVADGWLLDTWETLPEEE